MATVRKRILPSGLVVWRASYTDGSGTRRTKQFPRKSDGETCLSKRAMMSRAAPTRQAVYRRQ
jgi:integrase